jgi:hypothetical protein
MIRPIVRRRRARHTRLHDALTALEETHKLQAVEVPEESNPLYYQKYVHMLAERWGMHIATGLKMRGGRRAVMFITERAR